MQREEIDNAFPAVAERVVEYPCGVLHSAAKAGSSSAIDFADSSIITMAEASSGSRNPADSPTATQLWVQNFRRYPELMLIFRKLRSQVGSPRASRYFRNSPSAASSDEN